LTAKLILQDGSLQEFSNPVRVSHVLQRNPNCFVCSSDDMDFDTTLCAIDADDQLQPGELYFVLPLRLLNSPLRTQEMRALAVKPTQALNLGDATGIANNLCGCGINKKMDPPLLLNNNLQKSSFLVTHGGGGGGEGFRVRRKTRTAKSSFNSKLTVILEEQFD
ncbi:hypothetical protein Gohar_004115, partial [Gossypium harknessii]|nr:hypothetical protein [Gossypium harknessii]